MYMVMDFWAIRVFDCGIFGDVLNLGLEKSMAPQGLHNIGEIKH